MRCKISGDDAPLIFEKLILGRHQIGYYLCPRCGFLQTSEPHWLDEAYSKSLSATDTALALRPLSLRAPVCRLISKLPPSRERFLDYGGGAGLFTRMMRDLGYDFYRFDKFAPNLFAQNFDLDDLAPVDRKFSLVTAFEVFEHLVDPVPVLEEILAMTDHLLLSTEVQPSKDPLALAEWDYLGPVHGQHVSFYSEETFRLIAGRFGRRYQRCGTYLHLFSKEKVEINLDRPQWLENFILRKARALFHHIRRSERYWLTRRVPLTEADRQKALSFKKSERVGSGPYS